MEKEVNVFNKGLNKDIDVSYQSNDSLREAYGFRLLSFEGTNFIATNLKGTIEMSALPQGYIPLQVAVGDDIAFIFSHNPITNRGQVGCFPSPVGMSSFTNPDIEYPDLDLEYVYKPLRNYVIYTTPTTRERVDFDTDLFNFDIFHNLQVEARIDYDNSFNLYFTDYKNNVRVINTGLIKQDNKKYKLSKRIYVPENFNDTINLILTSNELVNIDYLRQDIGGKLNYGAYIYHVRYSQDKINKTRYLASSFPVYVYDPRNNTIAKGSEDSRYGNQKTVFGTTENPDSTKVNLSNVMQITGLDTQFKYYHISVEYVGGVENEFRTFEEIDIAYEITGSTATFVHTGLEKVVPLSEQELNAVYANIQMAKSITQQDSRLLLFNVTAREGNEYYKYLHNFSQRIKTTHIKKKINNTAIPELSYKLDGVRVVSDFMPLTIDNAGYKDPYHIYYNLGYHYGEIYQFGVQYIFKDNSISTVFLIEGNDDLNCSTGFISLPNTKGVYRFPKRNASAFNGSSFTSNLHTDDIIAIFPRFIIPDWNSITGNADADASNAYIRDNVLGLRFVRLPRKKDAYAQGWLLPTYRFPFTKWGDSYNREPLAFFNNFSQDARFSTLSGTPPSIKRWFQRIIDGDINTLKFFRDEGNIQKVVPLPLGYIEGNRVNCDNEYQNEADIESCIMNEAYHDPFRYAFICSDLLCNEGEVSNILNQVNISFEVVGGAQVMITDLTRLNGEIGIHNNNYVGIVGMFRLDFYSSLPIEGIGYGFKGTSYFVYANKDARNEKFSSQISCNLGGGLKHAIGSCDPWTCPDTIGFNSYIGIRIGSGISDTEPEAEDAFISGGNLHFRSDFVKQFYTDGPASPIDLNVFDACWLSVTDDIDSITKSYMWDGNNVQTGFTDRVVVIDLFLGSQGRRAVIDDFYDELREASFFFPITRNYSLQDIQSNGFIVIGVNGDNYQGPFYRKIFYRDFETDAGNGLGIRKKRGGNLMVFKCDNNFNPYSRVRELVSITDREYMSENTEGNRRSFFPVYAYDKLYKNIAPTYWYSSQLYPILINEAIWKYAKTYLIEESRAYLKANNINDNSNRVNNIYVREQLSIRNYFPTRVYYSNKHITNSFVDNYRAIMPMSYQDYDISLGLGVAIKAINNQVYIIQENGVSMLSFNERQFVGEGENVYIDTNTVLSPYQQILSRKYGSQHIDSVVATDNSIYFVDVINKAICRIAGAGVEVLSENRISSFLTKILSKLENVSEIQSSISIRSYYHRKYNEVIFVITDLHRRISEGSYCIVYSEKLDVFILHPYLPQLSFNLYNNFYTLSDRESPLIAYPDDSLSFLNGQSKIYHNDANDLRNFFYGETKEMFFHYIVNKNFEIQKVFDNIAIVSNHILPSKLYYKVRDEAGVVYEEFIEYDVNGIPTNVINKIVNRLRYIEHTVRGSIAYSNKASFNKVRRRNRDKVIEIGVYYLTNSPVEVSKVITSFRYSYS